MLNVCSAIGDHVLGNPLPSPQRCTALLYLETLIDLMCFQVEMHCVVAHEEVNTVDLIDFKALTYIHTYLHVLVIGWRTYIHTCIQVN